MCGSNTFKKSNMLCVVPWQGPRGLDDFSFNFHVLHLGNIAIQQLFSKLKSNPKEVRYELYGME